MKFFFKNPWVLSSLSLSLIGAISVGLVYLNWINKNKKVRVLSIKQAIGMIKLKVEKLKEVDFNEQLYQCFKQYILFGFQESNNNQNSLVFETIQSQFTIAKETASRMHLIMTQAFDSILKDESDQQIDIMLNRIFFISVSLFKLVKQNNCHLLQTLLSRLMSLQFQNKQPYLSEFFSKIDQMSEQTQNYLFVFINQILEFQPEHEIFIQKIVISNTKKLNKCSNSPFLCFTKDLSQQSATILIQTGICVQLIQELCQIDYHNIQDITKTKDIIVRILDRGDKSRNQFLLEYLNQVEECIFEKLAQIEESGYIIIETNQIIDLVHSISADLKSITQKIRFAAILQTILFFKESLQFHIPSNEFLLQLRVKHMKKKQIEQKMVKKSIIVETNIVMQISFVRILIRMNSFLPYKQSLVQNFSKLLQTEDDSETQLIIRSLINNLSRFIFMKDILITMIEKNVDKQDLDDFKSLFYQPSGMYEEIILGIQILVLIGGDKLFCENITQQWKKDGENYSDFQAFMRSDLNFILEILENDFGMINMKMQFHSNVPQVEQLFISRLKQVLINCFRIYGNSILKNIIYEYVSKFIYFQNYEIIDLILGEVAIKNENNTYSIKLEYSNSCYPIHLRQQGTGKIKQLISQQSIEPSQFLKDIRRVMIENIIFHTEFLSTFIQNIEIFLIKFNEVLRILGYVFDVIEEQLQECILEYKINSYSLKSMLMQYIFDNSLTEQVNRILNIRDEQIQQDEQQIKSLEQILNRIEIIKKNIKQIFTDIPVENIF